MNHSLPDSILSLTVYAFGREWELVPFFEPIWKVDGSLKALELLSRVNSHDTDVEQPIEQLIEKLSKKQLRRIIVWQLELADSLLPWYSERNIILSINVTRSQSFAILSNPKLSDAVLKLSPWLRLEISENFLNPGSSPELDPVLTALRCLAPLWLDDFGAGTAGLAWLMTGQPEIIKIDHDFFSVLSNIPEGIAFLNAVARLALKLGIEMTAEGISSYSLMHIAQCAGISYCQGRLWQGVYFTELNTLLRSLQIQH